MQTYTDCTYAEMAARGVLPGYRSPHINTTHIDGPLLIFSDGQCHWLTFRERILLWLGWTDAFTRQRALRPRMVKEFGNLIPTPR